MQFVFWLGRYFPAVAISGIIVFSTFAMFYRRKQEWMMSRLFYVIALTFGALLTAWLIFRGDVNSDAWVRAWLG